MTMRPPTRNDGSIPSQQRKRVATIVTTSSHTSGSDGSPLMLTAPATTTGPQQLQNNDPYMNPAAHIHFNTDSGSADVANYLSVSTSSSNSSSDSGSSSDCGKDLVKRKRYTTAKSSNRGEVDLAGVAAGRRLSAHDSSSSLTLVKNSASLIFTKKISSGGGAASPPVVHRKRDTRGASRRENRSSLHGIGEHIGAAGVETVLRKERTHSWYASLYTTLDEEVELDATTEPSSRPRNLAPVQPHPTNDDTNDSTYLLDHSNQHQVQIHQNRSSYGPSTDSATPPNTLNLHVNYHQLDDGPQAPPAAIALGGPVHQISHQPTLPPQAPPPKYSRFEQLIKSLVGRKVSRDVAPNSASSVISATPVHQTSSPHQPPPAATILPSPEILITRSPSERNLIKNDKISSSTASLNAAVQQKLWSVVPLLRREGSCASLQQLRPTSGAAGGSTMLGDGGGYSSSGLKKCETVLALSRSSSNLEHPIRAQNRLRDSSSSTITCSRCSSLLSLAANGSRYSLNMASGGGFVAVGAPKTPSPGQSSTTLLTPSSVVAAAVVADPTFTCKLCLGDVTADHRCIIGQCGCTFCTECMVAYVEFEILEGAYEISCPDALCPVQGALTIDEITRLSSASLVDKHNRYRLNREVELDKCRTWCPKAGCDTVCLVDIETSERVVSLKPVSMVIGGVTPPCSVHCPTCREEFCSGCKKTWHPTATCEENSRRLAAEGLTENIGIPFDNDLIKCCPTCSVPIEKDEGCAQMMCKRCKHVFCWYCLASLDDDFLLRHYDRGPCKNKLGHSRASVVWHRAQVIGIFAGFGILLLVASPLLLLAAPCIVCCKCRICSGAAKMEENDFEEIVALHR